MNDECKEEDCNYITKSKLKPYFSSDCYSGFDLSKEDNFYKVYGDLFAKLDKEEEMEEQVGEEHYSAEFGDNYSTAEEVFRFYTHWSNFSTLKKFEYVDKYKPSEAPNRQVKRFMENENKKERTQKRRDFNEMMDKLVEYVQNRDPRYLKFKRAEEREKQAKKQAEEEEREKRRAEEQERLRKHREELAQKYAQEEEEALASGDYDEVLVEEYRCDCCKKVFKKEKQLQNHLQSKKHKEAYAKFMEGVQLDEETEGTIRAEEERKRKEQEEEEVRKKEEMLKELEKEKKVKTRPKEEEKGEEEKVEEGQEEEELYVSKNKMKKMSKQGKKGQGKA